jgi:G3E family GTPase
VNDVASINIDAKLVRNDRNRARSEQVNTTADLADTIELANGCACECTE